MSDGRGGPAYLNQRRALATHAEVLQVHQDVLQKHAQLHLTQAEARAALKRDVDGIFQRPLLGRLRWLLTGK